MALLISVNVGLPRKVMWKGRPVTTGIFKNPVDGPAALHRHNLDAVTDRLTSRFTAARPRRSTCIQPSTTTIGSESLGTAI